MSFMYKSMMTRGPGKRKIKLQEENILHLMQGDDEDDDEDDDFQVTEDQELVAEESCDDSESSSDTSSSSDDEDSSSNKEAQPEASSTTLATESTQQAQNRHRCKRQPYVSPTIQSTNAMIGAKWSGTSNTTVEILEKMKQQLKVSTAGILRKCDLSLETICCVCLSKRNANGIIVCSKCRISVHKDCYGGITNTKSVGHGFFHWFCASCISGVFPSCELCPSTNGCMKETTNGQWCHITCARYILGKDMYSDGSSKELIDTSSLNYKEYGSRECSLCDDRLLAKTGMCVQCDAGFCKSYFHVTCAQKYGLLSENESQNCDTDPYFVYCSLHMGKEKMVQMQKLYIVAFAAVDFAKNTNLSHDTRQKDKVMNLLKMQRKLYVESQCKRYPVSPVRGTPPARELTSNAAAMKILNRKAEIMFGFDQRSPALYFPKPSDVRKRHHVAPALTGEFMSHYADRELRLVEMQERIHNVVNENEALLNEQAELKERYEKLENDLVSLQQGEENIVKTSRSLFSRFSRLKLWADENKAVRRSSGLSLVHISKLDAQMHLEDIFWKLLLGAKLHNNVGASSSPMKKFLPLKPDTRTSLNSLTKKRSPNRKRLSSVTTEEVVKKAAKVSASVSPSLLKKCGICGGDKQQHLLVDCDVCKRWLHLSCLDPPLTQFPKKTKFSLWQCSDCVSSSSEESDAEDTTHGSHITSEGRRHTRRSRRPPEKLSTMLINDHNYKEQKKMINRISRMYQRNCNKPKRFFGTRLQHARPKENLTHGLLKVRADQGLRTTRKSYAPNSQNSNVSKNDAKVSEARVAVEHNASLDNVTSTRSLPSLSRHAKKTTTKKTSPVLTVSLPTKINKPIILQTTPSTMLPGAAIPIKPMNKAGLIATTSAILSSRVRKPINQNAASLKSTEHTEVEQRWPTQASGLSIKQKMTIVSSTTHSSTTKEPEDSGVPLACVVCKDNKNFEEMMSCHTCKNSYHIWCCDPPLSSRIRPKKYFSWECSRCHPTEDVENVTTCAGSETTQDGRRKITRRRRPPEKFANVFYSCSQQKMFNSVLQRTSRIRTQKDRRRNLQKKLKKFSITLGSTTQKMDYNFANDAPKTNKQNGKLDSGTANQLPSCKKQAGKLVSTDLGQAQPNLPTTLLTKPTTFYLKHLSDTTLPTVGSDTSFQKTQESIKAAVSELLSWELMSRVNVLDMPTTSRIRPSPASVNKAATSTLNKSNDSKVTESPSKLVTVVLPKPPSVRSLPKSFTTAKVTQSPLPAVEKFQTSPSLTPSNPAPCETQEVLTSTSTQEGISSQSQSVPQTQLSITHSDANEPQKLKEVSNTPVTGVCNPLFGSSFETTMPPADNPLLAQPPEITRSDLPEPANHIITEAQLVFAATDTKGSVMCTSSSASLTKCKSPETPSDNSELSTSLS